jgi:hypothetical protein
MSELVAQLRKQLEEESVVLADKDKGVPDGESPNLDRLTVGVDLGDQWSHYCILGLSGETLTEGQFRTRRQEARCALLQIPRAITKRTDPTGSDELADLLAIRCSGSKRRIIKARGIDGTYFGHPE